MDVVGRKGTMLLVGSWLVNCIYTQEEDRKQEVGLC